MCLGEFSAKSQEQRLYYDPQPIANLASKVLHIHRTLLYKRDKCTRWQLRRVRLERLWRQAEFFIGGVICMAAVIVRFSARGRNLESSFAEGLVMIDNLQNIKHQRMGQLF